MGSGPVGPRFETARFHIQTGPETLFHRVRFKMQGRRTLKFHGPHVQQRVAEYRVPVHLLQQFDSDTWQVVTAEVRTDSGKFVNSAWTCEVAGQRWWVVIGLGDTVQTIIRTDKAGLGSGIVTSGPLYEQVLEVNAALMKAEASDLDAPVPVERQDASMKSGSEKLEPSVAFLLKTVDKQCFPPRPKKFRTYQHLLWFARAVQAEARLRQSAASIANAHAATSDPDLVAVLADGGTRLQRQVHALRNELGHAAGAAMQDLAQVPSVLALGKADMTGSQVSAAEQAENLLRLLPPYRDLLSRPLSQGVPRHGEKMAEAVTRLVLAVARERGVAVPPTGPADALTDWQRDQLEDEADRNSRPDTSRGNGWASSSGNVNRNAWPIRDPRARRFRG